MYAILSGYADKIYSSVVVSIDAEIEFPLDNQYWDCSERNTHHQDIVDIGAGPADRLYANGNAGTE